MRDRERDRERQRETERERGTVQCDVHVLSGGVVLCDGCSELCCAVLCCVVLCGAV